MSEKMDSSTHWSVYGTLSHAEGIEVEGVLMDGFIDEFCLLAEKYDLRFIGFWKPLTQAEIDGEED